MEANVQAKKCSCCGREKPVSEFRKDGRAADGYSKVCNVCRTERRITAPGANSRITPVFHEELVQYPPPVPLWSTCRRSATKALCRYLTI